LTGSKKVAKQMKKSRIGTSVRIGIAVILLVWIFHTIFREQATIAIDQTKGTWNQLSFFEQWQIIWINGSKTLWNTLTLISPLNFLFSVYCVGVTVLLGAWRWHILLRAQEIKIQFRQTFKISVIGQFFNAFLLGATGGDVLKAYYATMHAEEKKADAISAVIADRILGLLSMLIFAVILIFPNRNLLLINGKLALLTLLTVGMCIGCLGIFFLIRHGGIPTSWIQKIPRLITLQNLVNSCRNVALDNRIICKTVLVSMVLNLFCVLQFSIIAYDLNLEISFLQLAVIVPMIICISSLPITPSGLGIRENLYVLMLGTPLLGIPATKALSLSLIAYFGFLLWSALGSIFYAVAKKE